MQNAARWLVTATLGMVLCGLCGCGGKRESITAAGSTAFQPFAEQLAEQFMAANPGTRVVVQGGGSAVGIQAALSGAADIGMADLVSLPPEAASLTATVVARDGIAVVVHPANTVSNLTAEQVRGIFHGTIRNWKDVGGADAPITVVSREAGSGTRTSFEQIMKMENLTPNAIIQDSNGTVRETVANDPKTVGYLSHGLLNARIRAVAVDGHHCSNAEIVAGTYAVIRPVFLLTRGAPTGLGKAYIDHVLSPAGQKSIQTSGLLPAR